MYGKKTYKKAKKTYKRAKKYAAKNTKILRQIANPYVTVMNTDSKVRKFKRTIIGFDHIKNGAVDADLRGVYTLSLDQLSSYTEFTNLFSKYRIEKVKFMFTALDLSSPGSLNQPLYVWKNNQSGLIPAGIGSTLVNQTPNVFKVAFSEDNKTFEKSVYPYWVTNAYSGGYAQMDAKHSSYIDCAYPQVSHYTIAYLMPAVTGNALLTYLDIQVDVEITLAFKDLR